MDEQLTGAVVRTDLWKAPGRGLCAVNSMPASGLIGLIWSMGLVVLMGCSSGTPQEGVTPGNGVQVKQPPTVRSVTIVPTPLTLSGPIAVHVDAHHPQGGQITKRFQWIVNGNLLVGATGPELAPDRVRRGDEVSIEVVVSDGLSESTPYRTKPVVVVNTPPTVIRVILESEAAQVIRAKVDAVDPDGDEIQYTYRWWRNDKVIKDGVEPSLETTGFSRKDVVVAEVVARDSDAASLPMRATPIVLGNSPPQITSDPSGLNNRERYEYTVQAKDQDGDAIAYGLEIAPPGMTIDRLTGQISWKVLPGLSGAHRVKVMAEDGQGGTAWQEFELPVPSGAPAPQNQPPHG